MDLRGRFRIGIAYGLLLGLVLMCMSPPASSNDASDSSTSCRLVILGASYALDWPIQQLDSFNIVNRGIGGNQSFEMADRFESDVIALDPDGVIIWGFINDIFRADPLQMNAVKARIVASYKQMLAAATDPQYLTTPDFQTSAIVSENLAGNDLLEHALEFLQQSDDPVFQTKSERLGADLGAMTSLFLTGTRCDLGDTEAVARCARWARDILALGLRMVTGDNVAMGAKALAYLAPATILQAGMGMLIPLRQRARKVLADKRLDTTTTQGLRMDPPLDVILQSLSLDIPGRWPPLDEGRDLSPTPMDPLPGELVAFADLVQLGRAEDLLEEAEQLADLACDKLGWEPHVVDDRGEICGSTLLMTALVNLAKGKEPSAVPVTSDEAAAFREQVLNSGEEDLILDAISGLSPAMQVSADGTLHPALERDPLRRLILRLIHLGRARIASGDPSTILVD